MIILPAIDMIDGQPVRLVQGRFEDKTVVADDILTTAEKFESLGAEWLHMVDLDGAKAGKRMNQDVVKKTAQTLSIPLEIGGGIRTMGDVSDYIENGVSRVILGTSAIEDQSFVKEAVRRYGEKIAVGIDCKDGYACGRGWLSVSKITLTDLARQMEDIGVQTVIVTDISKDGTLNGPNLEMLAKLKMAVNMNIIASGGIRDIENIKSLRKLGIYGAITGKAVYAGTLDLKEAIEVAK